MIRDLCKLEYHNHHLVTSDGSISSFSDHFPITCSITLIPQKIYCAVCEACVAFLCISMYVCMYVCMYVFLCISMYFRCAFGNVFFVLCHICILYRFFMFWHQKVELHWNSQILPCSHSQCLHFSVGNYRLCTCESYYRLLSCQIEKCLCLHSLVN